MTYDQIMTKLKEAKAKNKITDSQIADILKIDRTSALRQFTSKDIKLNTLINLCTILKLKITLK